MARKTPLSVVAQYVATVSGRRDIAVVHVPNAASSHVAQATIQIDLDRPHVFDTAAHEIAHHELTAADAMKRAPVVLKFLVNCLEDARIDVRRMERFPGLHALWSRGRIRAAMPLFYDEKDATFQCLKAAYLTAAGWPFDPAKVHPETARFIRRFVKAGFPARVLAASDAYEIIRIAKEVAALLPTTPPPPPPTTQCEFPTPQPTDEEGEDDENGQPVPGEGESEPDENEDEDDGTGCGAGLPSDEEGESESETGTGTGEPSDEEGEDEPGKGGTGHGRPSEEDEDGGLRTSSGEYEDYDADEKAAKNEIAKRFGRHADDDDDDDGPTVVQDDEEVQKVTGGATAREAKDRAARLAKQLLKRRWEPEPEYDEPEIVDQPITSAPLPAPEKNDDPTADKSVQAMGDVDKLVGKRIDLTEAVKACGAVGYSGQIGSQVRDWRDCRDDRDNRVARELADATRPFAAYMVRVIKTLLTCQNLRGWQNRERAGRFDNGRSTALVRGDLKVYRRREAERTDRPSVMLMVDVSGSMDSCPDHNTPRLTVARHAAAATMMLAESLANLAIPFEINMFNGYIFVGKTYDQKWDAKAKGAVARIANHPSGGTSAAEALAYAWVRANTRRENKRVVIMVTDGSVPENTKEIVKAISKNPKATVIGVGIGSTNVSQYFPHYLAVNAPAELPGQFAALLKRLTLGGRL